MTARRVVLTPVSDTAIISPSRYVVSSTAVTGPQGPSGEGGEGAVDSVNGETGVVVLTAADVGAASTAELAAEATLARNADNLTSGTVADARIASTIARDSEVTAAIAALSTVYQPLAAVLTATTASFTTADETKLDGIEALADVTDATNVAAAGAVMESDTSTASMSFVIDEDSMATDSATKVPTQQSVKAYADTMLPKVAAGAAVENLGAVEFNVNTVAATGATETLDTSVYGVHDCTMDQNCTFTFSNPAPSGKLTEFVLILRGAFTPTLPAAVDWPDASAPTYSTPSVYVFSTVDAGTTWLARQAGKAFG